MLAKLLFGHDFPVEIVSFASADAGFEINAKTSAAEARCTECNALSKTIHSRYYRVLRDVPLISKPVVLRLQVRRFKCGNTNCPRQIFVESIEGLAKRFQRSTLRSVDMQREISLSLGGEAGARLAKSLGLPISGDSLLRRLASIERLPSGELRVIGVDDWALRRGQTYGTLICDLERRRPVAMLKTRSAEALIEWLKAHPEIEIISRDRAGEYARAAATGAPQAIQIADRWHLLRNSTEALQKVIELKQAEINAAITSIPCEKSAVPGDFRPMEQQEQSNIATSLHDVEELSLGKVSASKALNYQAVQELSTKGYSQRSIARTTGLGRATVRKYIESKVCPFRKTPLRPVRLIKFKNQIQSLIENGVTGITDIFRRLIDQGFDGSYDMVRRYLKSRFKSSPSTGKKVIRELEVWSSRKTAWFLASSSKSLSSKDEIRLNLISQACPDVRIAADLTISFGRLIRERNKAGFGSWIIAAAEACVPKPIRNFAASLLRDRDAVEAALEQPWSNGQLEGQINRLKMLKRQMYGRANIKLLECRMVNAA